ncbi:MAG: 2-methylaconitate cis-trans isomerase PrpF [Sulfuricella sp.]|nr:2-methylaconitate cis-trans isomerase PrpF [Sulfuricella sp.]
MTQLRIPAVYMRGGTSKGVFFLAADLPADPHERDRLLLRVIGSPDPYGKHIDGMGGATSSTSKVAILAKSTRSDCDVDYLFGAVAVDKPVIDWSGNCGNLTAAVGPFAIHAGLVAAPPGGHATVRIWQANVGKRIIAHVPMHYGEVQEEGDFQLDGVTFPGAEIKLEFLDPGDGAALFPSGARLDRLDVPGVGVFEATLINAGNPTIFIDARSLGLRGTELQDEVNGDAGLLARAEAIRAHGAVAMGLAASPAEASAKRPATPKLACLAAPRTYTAAGGKVIEANTIDLLVRIFSMGQLHHAMTGTGAVALAAAAAIPGTLPQRLVPAKAAGQICYGHPSGTQSVGATAHEQDGQWIVTQATMSRSARRLMDGWVRIPSR